MARRRRQKSDENEALGELRPGTRVLLGPGPVMWIAVSGHGDTGHRPSGPGVFEHYGRHTRLAAVRLSDRQRAYRRHVGHRQRRHGDVSGQLFGAGGQGGRLRQRRLRPAHGRHRAAHRSGTRHRLGSVGAHHRRGRRGEGIGPGGVKLVALVHLETSTGVWQPVEDIAALAKAHDCLFVLDTVTSLGGVPVRIDEWGVDAAYSGTQKCLSAPPGLAPVTVSRRARQALHGRTRPVQSWYLDLSMIEQYWGDDRAYRHTAPISMVYALREALRVACEEGWEARWARHLQVGAALQVGLRAMGLELLAQEGYRAPMLTTVAVPPGVDEAAVRTLAAGVRHRDRRRSGRISRPGVAHRLDGPLGPGPQRHAGAGRTGGRAAPKLGPTLEAALEAAEDVLSAVSGGTG